jgi:hypothetical protein
MLLITSFHMLDSSKPYLHSHLNNRALFLFRKDPIPSPPALFGNETVDQPTLHRDLPSSFPDHKKHLNFFSIYVATATGIGNKERK